MIEVKNLTKYYGDHKAVNNLSFVIKDGTVCGFLGQTEPENRLP